MPYLLSSSATQSTTVMLSWCRTLKDVWLSGATAGLSCCFTHWEGGPRTMTCPSPGEWSSTLPCWRKASLIQSQPSSPSSLHPWCMRGQPRWSWWGMSFIYLFIYFCGEMLLLFNNTKKGHKKEGSCFLLNWHCRGLTAHCCLQIPEG